MDSVPAGMTGLIPHLVCSPAAGAIDYYKRAFGAVELARIPAPGGDRLMHAALTIDGHAVFLCDDFPEYCGGKSGTAKALGGTPVTLHRYVPDCDAALARAADAGGTITMPAHDAFWGDRYGQLTDPYGHVWSLATAGRRLTPQEIETNMAEAFRQMESAGMAT